MFGWVDPVIISKTELLLRSRFLQKCIAQIHKNNIIRFHAIGHPQKQA